MRRLAFILVPLLLLACGREPVAPDRRVTPAFGVASGPENPGQSPVFKLFQDGWYLTTVDWPYEPGFPEDRKAGGLVARHYDVLNAFCGAQTGLPVHEVQFVAVDDVPDVTVFHLQSDREIPIFIYRLEDLPPGTVTCEQLADLWVYRGTHQLRVTDNSLNGVTTNRTNSWGWSGRGTVQDRDGTEYSYTESSRVVFDFDKNGDVRITAHEAIVVE